jgi:hypothetical protein
MPRRFATPIAVLVAASLLTGVRQQAPVLLVRVIESASRQPLPNAEVIDLESGARRFTNTAGEARVAWPASARLRLRVRQLGYQFVDRDIARVAPGDVVIDTITVTLGRVAYALPDVTTRVTGCSTDADSSTKALAVLALGQLQMGAERYEAFRKAYPFQIRQKRRTVRFNPDGTAREVLEDTEQAASEDWGERYQPGRVVDRSSRGFSARLLFLSALADPVFWRHHCFAVHGIETLAQDRVLRLDFIPVPTVTEPDWMGTAFVDSATSMLRRVEFRITGLRDNEVPRRLEGYTTFRSPSPFIVIPDSTIALWWRREAATYKPPWTGPDVVQLLQLLGVTYRKGTPPAGASSERR